jgi:peptidoglycan/xylan/chitin deacetylase (PgdA/CDA1 family)
MFANPSQVAGLSTHTITTSGSGRRIHITYPTLARAPGLADELHAESTARLRAFMKKTHPASGARLIPELNIDWELPAVSDQIIGVRLSTAEFDGAQWRDSIHTVWYDLTARRPLESAALLNGRAALATLADLVKKRLIQRKHDSAAGAVVADRHLFDALAFNPKGDLVAEFDDAQLGMGSHKRMVVAIPREKIMPLLSPAGTLAREAAEAAPGRMPPKNMFTKDRPRAQSKKYGTVDCAKVKCVALTFEDGPGGETPRLLSTLAAHGARATFLVTGSNAVAQPDLLRRMSQEGHLIANHSWSHRNLAALSSSEIADQLGRTQDAVYAATGENPMVMCPPYGSTGPGVDRIARRMGLTVLRWNVDTMDRTSRDTASIIRRAVDGARPNSVIRMHDVYRASVDALPSVLDQLARRGYVFVTVPELPSSRPSSP